MATRETGGQEQRSKRTEEVEDVEVSADADVQERVGKLKDDIDDLLDDIDDVLEENAEDWVRGFVQKGGQ